MEFCRIRPTCEERELEIEDITLLSIEEYEAAKEYIPLMRDWWWLRSPGLSSNYAAYVNRGGWVFAGGTYVDGTYGVVRPALKISNLRSLDLQIGDRICGLAGHDWTVISGSLILCNDGIGKHCFRKDWQAEDANTYETSDVKRFLEKWAAKQKFSIR